jgi:hexokinase
LDSDEGLQKSGTTMSQIPTYVTAVPNGTEKVSLNCTTQLAPILT